MATSDSDYDDGHFPELNRIGALMRDLISENGNGPAARVAPVRTGGTPTKKRSRRIGPWSVTQYSQEFNWRNAELKPERVDVVEQTGGRLGGVRFGVFASAMNWTNSLETKAVAGMAKAAESPPGEAPISVENFMSEFAWD